MVTTIQLSDETKRMLDILRTDRKTYDDIVKELLKKRGVPKSMYGTAKLGGWSKNDRANVRDR